MELFGVTLKRKAVVWLSATIVAVNGFFPAVWILLTSLKTETELIRSPITYLPDAPTRTHNAVDSDATTKLFHMKRRIGCAVNAVV